MKLRGSFKRAIEEYKFFTVKNWTIQDVGEFWDTVHDYDEIDDETYAYKRRFHDSIRMCSIPNQSKILDVDCRTGNGMVFYNENNKIKEGTCVGFSSDFLRVCKERLKKYNVKAEIQHLKQLPLDFKDSSFDAILCLETIEHLSDHMSFLKELKRVLKDDGEMILSMPNLAWEPVHWIAAIFAIHHSEGPHNFLSKRKIRRLLRKSGFKIVKERNTVIIPAGPRWFTKFGETLEKNLPYFITDVIGLRRIIICKK